MSDSESIDSYGNYDEGDSDQEEMRNEDEETEKSNKSKTDEYSPFSSKLHKELQAENLNLVFCPYGVANVFAMLSLGAGGETKKEIDALFEFTKNKYEIFKNILKKLSDNQNFQKSVTMANKIFIQNGLELKTKYIDNLTKQINASVDQIDFCEPAKAAKIINEFAAEMTKGLIQEIVKVGDFNPLTKMVLVNAIHFNGDWKKGFRVKDTKDRKFYLDKNETIEVQTMWMYDEKFNYGNLEDFNMDVIELAYKNLNLSMLIFLPEGHGKFKMPQMTTKEICKKMTSQKISMLGLPKFKIESDLDLTGYLNKLGIKKAFSEDTSDFSGISDDPLFIGVVKQRAAIEADEKGVTAAAVTYGSFARSSCGKRPAEINFIVDRPFGFQIVDKDLDFVLFEGRIGNPNMK